MIHGQVTAAISKFGAMIFEMYFNLVCHLKLNTIQDVKQHDYKHSVV